MWANKTITEFWQQNEADFAGDVTATEIIRLSKKYIKGRIVDVGAGSGALVNKLPGAIGVDIVPRNLKVIEGDIANLPFSDNDLDTVFSTDVLEHLNDETLGKGLGEVNRVLKKGGMFIAIMPYKEDLKQGEVFCPNCKARFHRWGHLQVFGVGRIRALLESYGFKIVDVKVLPLGLMAEHRLVRYFWRLFVLMGFIKANTMFVVARS